MAGIDPPWALQGAVWPSAITMATNPLKNIPASLLCDSLLLLVLLIKVDYELPPQHFFQTPVLLLQCLCWDGSRPV